MEKTENAQDPVGCASGSKWKNAGDVWEIAFGRNAGNAFRAFTEFSGHERAGKTEFFEERPALVANVAEGNADLARSRHARFPDMAAVCARLIMPPDAA